MLGIFIFIIFIDIKINKIKFETVETNKIAIIK